MMSLKSQESVKSRLLSSHFKFKFSKDYHVKCEVLHTSYFLTQCSIGKSNYKTGIHREASSTFSQNVIDFTFVKMLVGGDVRTSWTLKISGART